MSITTGELPGVRIVDMPDLGTVTDSSSLVGERAGSGRFGALALRDYATAGVNDALAAETAARIAADALLSPRRWTGTAQHALGDVIDKARAGTNILVHCFGDSITEGFRDSGAVTLNSGLTLTANTYPVKLQAALRYAFENLSVPVVQNFGYSGDTTKQSYDRWGPGGGTGILPGRWSLAQAVADVAFLSWGYNDANGYGGVFATVAETRAYTALWFDRVLALGTVPILVLQAPIRDKVGNQKFQPYRDAQAQVAEEYGVMVVDSAETIGWKTDRWADGVHLTDPGYNELGWMLSAPFNGFAGRGGQRVAVGTVMWPEDWSQSLSGGASSALFAFAAARTGYLLEVGAAQTANLGVYCETDVWPLVTTYNAGATVRDLDIYYAGNGSGVPVISIKSPGTGELRKRVVGPKLHRGWRQLGFLAGANDAYIESIEFVGDGQAIATPHAGDRKSPLGGISSRAQEAADWCAVDYGRRLTVSFVVEFRGILPAAGVTGISFTLDQNQDVKSGSLNQYMVLRAGSDLIVRQRLAGVDTDVTASGFFSGSAGVDYNGPLIVSNPGGGLLDIRRVGNAGGAIGGSIAVGPVCPGLVVLGGSTTGITCFSFVTRD